MKERAVNFGDDGRSGYRAVWILILINLFCFLLLLHQPQLQERMALNNLALRSGAVYQLVTALFVHAGFDHIFFNMFGLYVFGSIVAPALGWRRFLALYFTAGLVGNVVWVASVWGQSSASCLGASGAVMGIMAATAMMFPHLRMMILFLPFTIELRTVALVYVGWDVLMQLHGGGNVAYLAHIGGVVGAYLFMIFRLKHQVVWDPLARLFGSDRKTGGRSGWQQERPEEPRNTGGGGFFHSDRVSQRELDALLDKISRGGINSLTEAEVERLRQAREQMRRQ